MEGSEKSWNYINSTEGKLLRVWDNLDESSFKKTIASTGKTKHDWRLILLSKDFKDGGMTPIEAKDLASLAEGAYSAQRHLEYWLTYRKFMLEDFPSVEDEYCSRGLISKGGAMLLRPATEQAAFLKQWRADYIKQNKADVAAFLARREEEQKD